jgi:hypothetical protein
MVKIVTLATLQDRLRAILADRPQLAASFEQALADQDEAALATAFETLYGSPNEVRLAVESAILDWLFGEERAPIDDIMAGHPNPSDTLH